MTQATTSAPATKSAPATAPRGRGRPQNFPGVKTVTRLYNLPETSVQLIEALAERREETLGVTLNAMILRAHKEMTRSK